MIYFNSRVILLFGISLICYAQALQVTMVSKGTKFSKTQRVEISIQYKNNDAKSVSIYKWASPQNELDDPLFRVSLGGKSVTYTGKQMKRSAPTENDVINLAPGQTVDSVVDLASAYNMSESGDYQVDFDMGSDQILWSKTSKVAEPVIIESKPTRFTVEGRQTLHADRTDRATFRSCAPSQQTALNSAMTSAKTYASNVVSYFNRYTQSVTGRYTRWFGTYSSTRVRTVKSHMDKIKTALFTQTFVFDCSCTRPGVFAYVYPSMPYRVYLCNAFWTAPTTGTDSKAGTIIHEASHFTILGGTQDYAYGQSSARYLASSDPTKAIMNADNHEYFSENNPAFA